MNELILQCSLGTPGGPTFAVKDSIDVAGYATTACSRALADAPPAARHAEVVERLLDSGWHLTGKTNMHELAFGMTGLNAYTGTPDNPQDANRIPGGSSSGSAAAVGAGLVDAALGTDTGGSIRGPAACCGVIGLKPTFGRVSRLGVAPAETTLDCVGPFAREMCVLTRVMNAIAPDFDTAAATGGANGIRVGVVRTNSLAQIGAALECVPAIAGWGSRPVLLHRLRDAFDAGLVVINAETWRAFGHLTGRGLLGADLEVRLAGARRTQPADVEAAEAVRSAFTAEVDAALADVDALILPTLPAFPVTLDEARAGVSVIEMSSLIRPFNLSGHPALSLPLPVQGAALKAGFQIVGRKGDDERICAIAAALEAVLVG